MKSVVIRAASVFAIVAGFNALLGCGALRELGKDRSRWATVPTRDVGRPSELADGWQELRDEAFDFSIRAPRTLNMIERPEDKGEVRAYTCNDGELVYVISATNEGCSSEREFAMLAEAAENGYLRSLRKGDESLDNVPEMKLRMPPNFGRQSRVTSGSTTHVLRVVATKRCLYVLLCSGTSSSLDDRVDAFMDGLSTGIAK